MTVNDVKTLLDAQVLTASDLDAEVHNACGSDMMSDVLAFVKDKAVLLTGLTNLHVIRTAEMLDVTCIVFVRGKLPGDEIVEMASEREMSILTTEHTLYTACGILYNNGLPGARRG